MVSTRLSATCSGSLLAPYGAGSTKIFGYTLTEAEKRNLATLVAYPERKLPLILQTVTDEEAWYGQTLRQLLQICRSVISKYPRDHVQGTLPDPSSDIIEDEPDIDPQMETVESNDIRIRVEDTDQGRDIHRRIEDLQALLRPYRTGLIKET